MMTATSAWLCYQAVTQKWALLIAPSGMVATFLAALSVYAVLSTSRELLRPLPPEPQPVELDELLAFIDQRVREKAAAKR
jgi:hypothetical protein